MDTPIRRPRHRINVQYRLTPRLQIGFEHNPAERETSLIGNWIAHVETPRVPMISLGVSSDRIGTPPPNKAYFVTLAKSIPGQRIAPYVSINYSETDQRVNLPFGANIGLSPNWDLLPMNDGRHSHLLLTWKGKDTSASLIWAWFKRTGVSVSWKF